MYLSFLGIGQPLGLIGYDPRSYWFGLVRGLKPNQTKPTSSLKWIVFTKAADTDQFPGLPAGARDFIRHEYMHKLDPTDGEIFRRVLVADHERDETAANSWSAMLTERKRRNLKELKQIDNGGLLAAITPLLPFAALWVDFQPGALNRVLPMRCREVKFLDKYMP